MRAPFISTKSRLTIIRRLLIVCVALAAISTSSFATVARAEGSPGGGSVTISIQYFSVMQAGGNSWVADGVIQAQNMSEVSIQFSGASNASKKPDSNGYFSLIFSAAPGSTLGMDATDSTGTAHAERTLDPFTL